MLSLADIHHPTLLLDAQKCKNNIRHMADKAAQHRITLKPHFKTHQSAQIAQWFKEVGVTAITVSSIKMARYFAQHGWKHITIAFPTNIRAMDELNSLANDVNLSVLVDNLAALGVLKNQLKHPLGIYIEVDCGAGRSGVKVSDITRIEELIKSVVESANISFAGFYSHPGHSYLCRGAQEITKLQKSVVQQMHKLRTITEKKVDEFSVCVGDTPTCSIGQSFEGIDEISPGNFVFYDLMQVQIGSCSIADIAVALACPVVAKHKNRKEIIVHGGAVHLSKEQIKHSTYKHFGRPVMLDASGWDEPVEDSYVKALSQEHGVVSAGNELFNRIKVGDLIGILPVHSCLTANLMGSYTTLQGETYRQYL